MSQNRSSAVMQQRHEAHDSLDFFPTPPWATRALMTHVPDVALDLRIEGSLDIAPRSVWEPACGEGHMAEVLLESFDLLHASDVFDYGRGYAVGSFVGEGADRAECPFTPDWVITNPPFNLAEAFLARALAEARRGVALLLRMAWLESEGRYERVFRRMPPSTIALFVERVPMHKGRWDPAGSSATAYCWLVWRHGTPTDTTRTIWIPPGQRKALHLASDLRRFTTTPDAPLFADVAA